MSIAGHKAVVEKYVEAMGRNDIAAIAELLSDDFIFRSMVKKPQWLAFSSNKQQLLDSLGMLSAQMKGPLTMTLLGMIGEGDQVAAEVESYGEMKDGRIYNNGYHIVFVFSGNSIREMREYSCSYTANEVFGG
jgi:ketosteroid isomerase-like protein